MAEENEVGRRAFFTIASAAVAHAILRAAPALLPACGGSSRQGCPAPRSPERMPQLGEIVFCESRSYGLVICGSKATMLVHRGGWKLFGPEVEG